MAVLKCKICGGTVICGEGKSVGTCENCGTNQTIPTTKDDNLANLYNRANNLRRKADFDQAAALYEKIIEQDDSEAEAHWGLVLCKFGVEYVQDPVSGRQVPTCHRTAYEAVTSDMDYLAAKDYSDMYQQTIYEAEAREIDRIQKEILAIANAEEPFDVFLCYKETDEAGSRTEDSVTANEIYYQLTQEGLKVFYAPITLEDKIGEKYEPYIFSALNSAKVMLVIGSREEYFTAPWVKNEWSRFLKIIRNDRSRIMIPCYKNMDAYRLPAEFSHLQAQDMSKLGFMMDILRAVKKFTAAPEPVRSAPEAQPEPAARPYAAPAPSAGNAPLTYEEKQRGIERIREDYLQLPDVKKNKTLMDRLHYLEEQKRSEESMRGLVRGIRNKILGTPENRSEDILKEILDVRAQLAELRVMPYSDYLASEMERRGLKWTEQELQVKSISESRIGATVTLGTFQGNELRWIVVSKYSNKLTLLCETALGNGPTDFYGQYIPDIPNYMAQGMDFGAPRLFTVSEYLNLPQDYRKAFLIGTTKPVWWRLCNNVGEVVLGKKLVPDVAPNGVLNQKGHLAADKRIFYRPAISVTFKE